MSITICTMHLTSLLIEFCEKNNIIDYFSNYFSDVYIAHSNLLLYNCTYVYLLVSAYFLSSRASSPRVFVRLTTIRRRLIRSTDTESVSRWSSLVREARANRCIRTHRTASEKFRRDYTLFRYILCDCCPSFTNCTNTHQQIYMRYHSIQMNARRNYMEKQL